MSKNIYYVHVKSNQSPDICFWEKDIEIDNEIISCLAFFYEKENANKYLNYLKKDNEFGIEYEVRSFVFGETNEKK